MHSRWLPIDEDSISGGTELPPCRILCSLPNSTLDTKRGHLRHLQRIPTLKCDIANTSKYFEYFALLKCDSAPNSLNPCRRPIDRATNTMTSETPRHQRAGSINPYIEPEVYYGKEDTIARLRQRRRAFSTVCRDVVTNMVQPAKLKRTTGLPTATKSAITWICHAVGRVMVWPLTLLVMDWVD